MENIKLAHLELACALVKSAPSRLALALNLGLTGTASDIELVTAAAAHLAQLQHPDSAKMPPPVAGIHAPGF